MEMGAALLRKASHNTNVYAGYFKILEHFNHSEINY